MSSFLAFVDDDAHIGMDNPREWREAREKFKGQEVVLTIQGREVYRSLKANAYYHGVVLKAAVDESKQSADSIHAFWCSQFLPDERKQIEFFNKMTGQRLRASVDTRRTSKLAGTPFYDFVEECRLWLQEWLGVTTPDPDPDYWRKRPRKQQPLPEAVHA